MRATLALIALGLVAGPSLGAAGVANAAALPPPPYAADPQYQARPQPQAAPQQGAQGYQPYRQPQGADRYSGGAAHPVAAPAPQQYAFGPQGVAPAAAPVRTLGWSGKVEAAQQAVAQQPQGGWGQMTSRWNAAAPQQARQAPQQVSQGGYPAYRAASAQPAASQSWRPLYPAGAPQAPSMQAPSMQAAPARAAPRTIYDPPAVPQQPAAPQRQASAQGPNQNGPHFYSLHREYGIEPDPIPIPPKFFGPTADLSAPPPDPVLKRVTDSSGQTHTQAVPTDDQGS